MPIQASMARTTSTEHVPSRIATFLVEYLRQETGANWSISAAPAGIAYAVPARDGGTPAYVCLHHVDDVDDAERFRPLAESVAAALGSIGEMERQGVQRVTTAERSPGDLVPHDLPPHDLPPLDLTPVSASPGSEIDPRMIAYFQPIVELSTGEVVAIEALARMQTDDAILGPDAFLDAYSTGPAMLGLFDRMLDSSLRFLAEFAHRIPDLSAALNLEFAGVPDRGLADLVARRLRQYDIQSDAITIELNERIAYELGPGALGQLRQLVELGVKLLLDDVPHSFHALEQLHGIPIAGAKLDRRYVQQVTGGERGATEVGRILSQAADLGIEVIAEGVETQAQCEALVELGCRFGQGYLFAVPQPAGSLSVVLGEPLVGSW